jgi:NAD(P)-dependent dehydrogenase (short-subunit alcohol dehydrogenase family)
MKTILLGHEGDPRDISHAVAYFASEEGKYVTGQVLSPNGGVTI